MEPSLEEIEATLARMEERYRTSALFPAYERLKLRFAEDLPDPRDLALSKAAALMMVRFADEANVDQDS
jgi:hypothetical protein